MSLMTCGAACTCVRCRGSRIAETVVPLCYASWIYVLGDVSWEGTGVSEFPKLPSNIGAWFEKYTSCVVPLLKSVLDYDRASLLTFYLLLMIYAWPMPDRFFQFLLALVLRLLYLVVSKKSSCTTWNWGKAFPVVILRTSETDPAWWGYGLR